MIRPSAAAVVYLCVAPTDLRKQATSLALLVEQGLKRNIFEPALYVFSNARRDRIRILYWERNGLVLWSKRLRERAFYLAADRRGRHGVDERRGAKSAARWL